MFVNYIFVWEPRLSRNGVRCLEETKESRLGSLVAKHKDNASTRVRSVTRPVHVKGELEYHRVQVDGLPMAGSSSLSIPYVPLTGVVDSYIIQT